MRLIGLGSFLTSPRAAVKRLVIVVVVAVFVVGFVLWLTWGASLPDDGDPVAITTDDAMAFVERSMAAAGGISSGGTVDLDVTQEELSSFLVVGSRLSKLAQRTDAETRRELEALQAEGDLQGTELLDRWEQMIGDRETSGLRSILTEDFDLSATISEPEVRFEEGGLIIVRGRGNLAFLSVPARVVVAPSIENGELVFDFVEGQLGRLPLPGGVFDLVADGVRRLLLAGHNVAEVTALEVGDGRLHVGVRLGG